MVDRREEVAAAGWSGAAQAALGLSRGMASGLISPSGDELERLRQQYDRLCDQMTRAAESDPAAAERVLVELQSLSERILLLQTARADLPDAPVAPVSGPPNPAPQEAPAEVAAATGLEAPPPSPGPASSPGEPPSPDHAAAVTQRPETTAARIVAFRVTPSVGPRTGEAAPKPASWRVDAPLSDMGAPDAATSDRAVSGDSQPHAPAAPPPAEPLQAAPAIAPHTAAPRKTAAAAKPAAAPPRPQPKPVIAPDSGPAAPSPAAPPAEAPGNATLFTSAIRQWLERHRTVSDEGAPAAAPAGDRAVTPPAGTAETRSATTPDRRKPVAGDSEAGSEPPPAFSRVIAAVEQQAAQIERILELCQAHQLALEQLEARLEARIDATRQVSLAPPELPELRAAVEEQRQRITALAKTIHNLAQWLAAQRAAPGR
jgi:hypothetical protein